MTEEKLEIIQYNQKQHYKEGVYKIIGIKSIEQPSRDSYFIPVQYQVECKNGELRYSMDGGLLRIEQNTKYTTILTHLDQVQNLKWGIQNSQNTIKWCPIWDGRIINAGGEVNKNNLKIGKWVELSDNYCNISKVTHEGIYNNGLRIGKWITCFNENIICEGEYDLKGIKVGKWEQIHDTFSMKYQIIEQGEYKNGKKIGYWNYKAISTKNKWVIGGGLYVAEDEKLGKWTEPHNNFSSNKYSCQILWNGNYKNGKKIGKWDILYSKELRTILKFECMQNYKSDPRGGGQYDEIELKQGIWIELFENFGNDSQVRSFGEYKNGKKIGRWNIQFRDDKTVNFINIGGGQYDDEGKQKGKWIELYEYYRNEAQLRFVGDYKEGIKQGFWGLQFRNYFHKDFQYCSVGAYDFGQKNGKWIELEQLQNFSAMYWYLHQFNFNQFKELNQMLYCSIQEWQVIRFELVNLIVQSQFQQLQHYIIINSVVVSQFLSLIIY